MLANVLSQRGPAVRPRQPFVPCSKTGPFHVRYPSKLLVSAAEEQQTFEQSTAANYPEATAEAIVPRTVFELDPAEAEELEVDELDAAQEQLIKWALLPEEVQEQDLDEMVDYGKLGDEEYEELYEELDQLYDASTVELKIGDKVMGTVYEIDDDGAYVEIGQKASGFVPLSECAFTKLKTPLEVLRVGMKREFMVVEDADDFGQTILSLAAMEATVFWQRTRQLQEEDVTVTCKVESANKGGLLVRYGPYEGFIPVSQFGPQLTPETMETLIGAELPVKFLEIDEERERLVLSNKRASASMMTASTGPALRVGDVVAGVVQSVKPYGAFVDIGTGVMGLLHVSQISHERITNVEKVLSEGDKLKVMVLSIDRDRGRVTVTTKKLEQTPGDMLNNPQRVFDNADRMAVLFRDRVEAAEYSLRAEQVGGYEDFGVEDDGLGAAAPPPPEQFTF